MNKRENIFNGAAITTHTDFRCMDAKMRRGIVGFVEKCFGANHTFSPMVGEGGTECRMREEFFNVHNNSSARKNTPLTRLCRAHNDSHGKISPNPFPEMHLFPYSPIHYSQKSTPLPNPLPQGGREGAGKRYAFTLAEVLITLGIIGVVAALTLPSVINKIQKRELQVGFKKAYSVLSQGVMNVKNELGKEGLKAQYCQYDIEKKSYYNASEFYEKFYNTSNINVIGKCTYPSDIKNFTNTATAYTSFSAAGKEKLENEMANGMCLQVLINAGTINIAVDVNGTKKPNRLGYDIFYFYIDNKDTLQPRKMSKAYTDEEAAEQHYSYVAGNPCTRKNNQRGNGAGCAYYALIDENPDDSSKGYWDSL